MFPEAVPLEAVTYGTACLAEGKCTDAIAAFAADDEERKHAYATVCGESFRTSH
jgi:hypothetical protein